MVQAQGKRSALETLQRAGLDADAIIAWPQHQSAHAGAFAADLQTYSAYWQASIASLQALPLKAKRSQLEHEAAQHMLYSAYVSRDEFLAVHAAAVYDRLTDQRSRFVRIEDLASRAATMFPGLVPSKQTLAQEHEQLQKDKDGHEIDQGILFSHWLADPVCGAHLCHAMLLPLPQSATYLAQFARDGKVDFGATYVERRGLAAVVNLRNSKYLNAEDDGTVLAQELAVDLCTLDEISQIAVMRGAPIDSGKYQGRRVFCTGINLTHLYYGKVPFLWYLQREMGFLNKIFRGTASPDRSPDEILGQTHEKMWIAAVDAFAIGGGCQYLLAMDVNIAASDAYLTLPARKEGIIPGAANLRLPRFVGDRVARQLIMMERRLECDSDVGRMICDLVVAPDQVDKAIDDTVQAITSSGVVSASCNRKSFRVAHEPLDMFRRYLAVYAREQAFCHFSPALIGNLERHWNAQNRKV